LTPGAPATMRAVTASQTLVTMSGSPGMCSERRSSALAAVVVVPS
jgi:hypothetical protein